MKNIENISYKKYEGRTDIVYEIGDKTSPMGTKDMIRCECGKRFQAQEENICSECGKIIEKDDVVFLPMNRFSYFNRTTSMFVDKVETEDGEEITANISMMLVCLSRGTGEYYPTIGDSSMRLRVKFNITKRTALVYTQKMDFKNDDDWEIAKLPVKFLNFTQPALSYFKSFWDIKLPEELVIDLLKLMKVDINTVGSLGDIDLYSLAWMNRVKNFNEAKRQRDILKILNYAVMFNGNEEDYVCYNKNINRVKRYLHSFHKPKRYDENIFEALCRAFDIDRDIIPKNLEKHYYMNPYSIQFAREHDILFENRDIRINAIKEERESGRNIYELKPEETYTFGSFNEKPFNADKSLIRHEILSAFKEEKNIYHKIRNQSNYSVLYDTAKMINQLKRNGVKFKTNSKLLELHDKASSQMRKIRAPKITFLNTVNDAQQVIVKKKNEYTFTFGRTPEELLTLGEITNTCVGSYYDQCLRGLIKIVYVVSEKIEAVIEVAINYYGEQRIVQAKGVNNSKLNNNIQEAVCQFAIDNGFNIKTFDISKSIANKANEVNSDVKLSA